jgi:uncharacterized membrane protein
MALNTETTVLVLEARISTMAEAVHREVATIHVGMVEAAAHPEPLATVAQDPDSTTALTVLLQEAAAVVLLR